MSQTKLALSCLIVGAVIGLAGMVLVIPVLSFAGGYMVGVAYCIHNDIPRSQP